LLALSGADTYDKRPEFQLQQLLLVMSKRMLNAGT
jgi:hypothetical protein